MTIIWQFGSEFWCEHLIIPPIVTANAAGRYNSPSTALLERPGRYVGGMVAPISIPNSDNGQALGGMDMLNQDSAALAYGDFITGVIPRVSKAAGTSGSVTFSLSVTLFLRSRLGAL